MANFDPAFEEMIHNEGGYQLTDISGDRGGKTYAGISQKYHPDWAGWALADAHAGEEQLAPLVQAFYKEKFWDQVGGDDITDQQVAASIFDFAVNGGIPVASRLAQGIVGANVDGMIGQQTVGKINEYDSELFLAKFALAKIQRYAKICTNDSGQKKFLLGWINRALEGVVD